MITIKFTNNVDRISNIVSDTMTPNQYISEFGCEVGERNLSINGRILSAEEKDMTFADLGVTDSATLLAVARKDNA